MEKQIRDRKRTADYWLYRTEIGRWISASAVTLVILVAVFVCVRPVFMTIDDARLKYVFAGYSSGVPAESYLFSYYPLSFILSKLYAWFPNFHWYAFYQFAVIGLSSVLIGKTLLKITYRRNLNYWISLLLNALIYLSAALISTILMHFEVTAALAGTAGVVLLLGSDVEKDKLSWRILDMCLSVAMIGACFVIQFNSFYAACCYLLVAVVFLLLEGVNNKNVKKVLKQLGCFVLCLVVVVAGVKMLESWSKDTPDWDEYMEYNKYRVSFWDYPHTSYQDDPELFEEMGWTEEFYNLTQSMYFMDERFSKENLQQFTERFSWLNFGTFDETKETFLSTFSSLYSNERLAVIQTVMMVLGLLINLAMLFNKKKRKQFYPSIISSICCIGGTALVVIVLAAKGRLPLRAWLVCSIPCICIVALLLIKTLQPNPNPGRKSSVCKGVVVAVSLVAWLTGMGWTYSKVVGQDRAWRDRYINNTIAMEEYIAAHPENVYVYDLMGAQNYSVFSIYPDENFRPTNGFVWGSSYLFTPVYQEQLENNGLTQLTTENLFDDNVYFIGHANGNYAGLLFNMLYDEYPEVSITAVDQINDAFYVYKISK